MAHTPGFFEGFFAMLPDLALIISPDGRLLKLNPACERTMGFSSEEALGRPILDFVHPDDLESALRKLPEVIGGKCATGFVVRCLCKDGSYKWIEWEAAPAPDRSLAFATGRDITERKRAQKTLEDKDRQLSTIFNSVSDALFLLAVESEDRYRFLTVNRRFLQLSGMDESQVVGMYLHELIPPPSVPNVLAHYREAIRGRVDVAWEEVGEFPGGARHGDVVISPIYDENGLCTNVVGVVRDLTEHYQSLLEKAKLEDQLRQAQKLESIGRLAGGIAHDFNNFLTVIQGYSELLQQGLEKRDPLRFYADRIGEAGERAARLTSQLLAFSRKQVVKSKPVNVNDVVRDTKNLLQSLIGEDISLVTRCDPDLGQVMADPDQLHQVLMNLAANARDAMPAGGSLTIETARVTIDESYVRAHHEAAPGPCVVMTVKDTGVGMDETTRRNVFEPFFTTKGAGKGTGLGLATVYGIVHQFNGWIEVDSRPGQGATFRIYLPRVDKEVAETGHLAAEAVPSGSETILLVEDEDAVRQLASTILTARGYSVVSASSGAEAIRKAALHSGQIHLLITDVVMPGMNGRELADRLKAVRPDIKVLFVSGYTADVIVNRGVIDFNAAFLAKPFTHELLAAKVREILNAGTSSRTRKAGS